MRPAIVITAIFQQHSPHVSSPAHIRTTIKSNSVNHDDKMHHEICWTITIVVMFPWCISLFMPYHTPAKILTRIIIVTCIYTNFWLPSVFNYWEEIYTAFLCRIFGTTVHQVKPLKIHFPSCSNCQNFADYAKKIYAVIEQNKWTNLLVGNLKQIQHHLVGTQVSQQPLLMFTRFHTSRCLCAAQLCKSC